MAQGPSGTSKWTPPHSCHLRGFWQSWRPSWGHQMLPSWRCWQLVHMCAWAACTCGLRMQAACLAMVRMLGFPQSEDIALLFRPGECCPPTCKPLTLIHVLYDLANRGICSLHVRTLTCVMHCTGELHQAGPGLVRPVGHAAQHRQRGHAGSDTCPEPALEAGEAAPVLGPLPAQVTDLVRGAAAAACLGTAEASQSDELMYMAGIWHGVRLCARGCRRR